MTSVPSGRIPPRTRRTRRRSASASGKRSGWSKSTLVMTAMSGCNSRNDQSYSSASTTISSPEPGAALAPIPRQHRADGEAGVGAERAQRRRRSCRSWSICRGCRRRPRPRRASASAPRSRARFTTGRPAARAAAISGLSGRTAAVATTRSADAARSARVCPMVTAMPFVAQLVQQRRSEPRRSPRRCSPRRGGCGPDRSSRCRQCRRSGPAPEGEEEVLERQPACGNPHSSASRGAGRGHCPAAPMRLAASPQPARKRSPRSNSSRKSPNEAQPGESRITSPGARFAARRRQRRRPYSRTDPAAATPGLRGPLPTPVSPCRRRGRRARSAARRPPRAARDRAICPRRPPGDGSVRSPRTSASSAATAAIGAVAVVSLMKVTPSISAIGSIRSRTPPKRAEARRRRTPHSPRPACAAASAARALRTPWRPAERRRLRQRPAMLDPAPSPDELIAPSATRHRPRDHLRRMGRPSPPSPRPPATPLGRPD